MAPQSTTEALAAVNKAIIEDAIRAQLSATFPVPPVSGPKPEPRPTPKEPTRMSEHGGYNGQYRALQTDVDNLKGNFADLRQDVQTWRTDLSGEIKELGKTVSASLDTLRSAQTNSSPDIYKMAGVAGVALVIIGGFASLAKTNLDTNITFTNDKIATQASIVRDDFAATNAAIRDVASAVKDLRDTTIPRAELEYRLSSNRDAINKRVEKDVLAELVKRYDSEIAVVTADLIRLKDGQVGRAEHEQHWKQYDDRLSLISNRLVELGRLTSGASANDQIKQLQDQLQVLQNRFIVAPK